MFLGGFEHGFKVKEVYRFDNRPVKSGKRYIWDMDNILEEIVNGIKKAGEEANELESIGVDSWGVDFGLIKDGELLKNPYSYRDPKLKSTLGEILEKVPKKEIFQSSGINHWNVANTLWQYHYLDREEPELLKEADALIMMPQLVSYLLGGKICGEETIASTSQMLDPETREWSEDLLNKLDLPMDLLLGLEKPGTKIGELKDEYCENMSNNPGIVLPASHDTASTVAGLPLGRGHRTFLSTGTWFVLGIELDKPDLNDGAFESGASNEMGVEGTTRFLKNVNGFFILEECRGVWKKDGRIYEYDDLLEEARDTDPFGPLIDPDVECFGSVEGNMIDKIASFSGETGQETPETEGEITRCIYESLALKTALTLKEILGVSGMTSDTVHLGGGGARNELFCQMLSSALEAPVYGGPAEAAAVGNILVQAKAHSKIDGIGEGRRIVEREMDIRHWEPKSSEKWKEARKRMMGLVG